MRTATGSYNPWNPVSEQGRVAHYPEENPWKSENIGCEQNCQCRDCDKYKKNNDCSVALSTQNKLFGMGTCGDNNNKKTSISFAPIDSGCGSCKKNDCGDDQYQYCFAPACSTVRPCIQDGLVNKKFPVVNYPL